ncbi:muts domain V-domain-containing protein [Radiomyces spectabilis]|uniref:muts domain V-domain-containing protein n=1 Tax=Radiomyces spectabilis TaxID=64574 RepID=UPI002220D20C|nr:muts domain V-domain-containing protein [Radiomyces spectabilis]KAI8374267.1 muts domain V-domain-containing protein [Radiomyces spectabilis]
MNQSPKDSIPDIDKPEQQTFVKFFRSLTEADSDTIRLFERDANQKRYYTFHGDNALYIAQHVYKTTSVVKYWGGDAVRGLATTSLSSSVAGSFLRDALLNKQKRIEIWTQKKNSSHWELSRKASPGNLQDVEDLLFLDSNMTAAPVVMAVKLATSNENKVVGVAFADATVKELGIAEFLDNELYSNFESLIIQLGVKECLLPADETEKDYELIKIRNILQRCGVVMTSRKKNDFNAKDIEQDLNRLLEGEISSAALPEFEMKQAMPAVACLIKYLSLLSDEHNFKQFKLRHHDLSQYMRLDASALGALNLMPGPQDGSNKSMSLYGLLNKCKTAQGSRLLAQWLKQPLLNLDEITQRQDIVEVFYKDTELRQSLQEDHLRTVPDLHRLAKRFQRGIANLQDVVRIYQVVIRLPALLMCLEACNAPTDAMGNLINEMYTSKLKEYIAKLEKLQELVETTIDLDALKDHEFIIKSDFDDELKNLREMITDLKELIENQHLEVAEMLGLDPEKKLKLEKHSLYGYCLRIGRADASVIRQDPQFIEYSTQKAGTYFSTGKMKHLNTQLTQFGTSYERRQNDLVKEVINIVATYCPVLELLGGVLAHMDVLVSFAHVSIMAPIPYIRPDIRPMGQGNVHLQDARHPCLEVQDEVNFIPNDVEITRNQSEFQIITGPNMGGKSTYIRQIGVIALMAQVGCFVPCTEAKLCIFDSILARVGAGDSQLKGVSTFMAEMLETATILKSASKHSLIIIDELGRGTSTYDGFGLAWAISEHIATQIRAYCLFATHFHELTALGENVPHVKNLNVAVHVGNEGDSDRNITLLYKVNEGVCDQSFGIHVAELANFPVTVVKLAKRKAAELEDSTNVDEESKKHKGDSVKDGTALVQKMIQEIASVDNMESLDHDMLLQRVRDIKNKYKHEMEANPYLQDLMAGL